MTRRRLWLLALPIVLALFGAGWIMRSRPGITEENAAKIQERMTLAQVVAHNGRVGAKRRAWDPVWCGAFAEEDGRGARTGVEPESAGPTTQASEGRQRSRRSVRARTSVNGPIPP